MTNKAPVEKAPREETPTEQTPNWPRLIVCIMKNLTMILYFIVKI